jgi:hypothetical protein
MPNHLAELLEKAKAVPITPEDEREQRESFAYGSANIENEYVTREVVRRASELLESMRKRA